MKEGWCDSILLTPKRSACCNEGVTAAHHAAAPAAAAVAAGSAIAAQERLRLLWLCAVVTVTCCCVQLLGAGLRACWSAGWPLAASSILHVEQVRRLWCQKEVSTTNTMKPQWTEAKSMLHPEVQLVLKTAFTMHCRLR